MFRQQKIQKQFQVQNESDDPKPESQGKNQNTEYNTQIDPPSLQVIDNFLSNAKLPESIKINFNVEDNEASDKVSYITKKFREDFNNQKITPQALVGYIEAINSINISEQSDEYQNIDPTKFKIRISKTSDETANISLVYEGIINPYTDENKAVKFQGETFIEKDVAILDDETNRVVDLSKVDPDFLPAYLKKTEDGKVVPNPDSRHERTPIEDRNNPEPYTTPNFQLPESKLPDVDSKQQKDGTEQGLSKEFIINHLQNEIVKKVHIQSIQKGEEIFLDNYTKNQFIKILNNSRLPTDGLPNHLSGLLPENPTEEDISTVLKQGDDKSFAYSFTQNGEKKTISIPFSDEEIEEIGKELKILEAVEAKAKETPIEENETSITKDFSNQDWAEFKDLSGKQQDAIENFSVQERVAMGIASQELAGLTTDEEIEDIFYDFADALRSYQENPVENVDFSEEKLEELNLPPTFSDEILEKLQNSKQNGRSN